MAEQAKTPDLSALQFERRGLLTSVTRDGEYLGYIKRVTGSDSSPRGGAYRTFHKPMSAVGGPLGLCYSRKEAVEDLLRAFENQQSARPVSGATNTEVGES